MPLDWHLIGIAAQTILFLAGVYAMVLRADSTGKGLKEEMKGMKEELHELKQIVIIQAVQAKEIDFMQTQIALLQQTVEDLRCGDGWVQGRHGVDREYGS